MRNKYMLKTQIVLATVLLLALFMFTPSLSVETNGTLDGTELEFTSNFTYYDYTSSNFCYYLGDRAVNCSLVLSTAPIAYKLNNGTYLGINTTIVNLSDSVFDYGVITGYYTAYFKDNSAEGQTVRVSLSGTNVTFQPHALNYRNSLGSIQQISMPEAVQGTHTENAFEYSSVYGAGIDLQYIYQEHQLKEKLVISNFSVLPEVQQYILDGGNPTLDLDFVFQSDGKIYVDSLEWDKTSQTYTCSDVIVKNLDNITVWIFQRPYCVDANNAISAGCYLLKKQGASMYMNLKINYTWLATATYPVVIDPSVLIGYIDNSPVLAYGYVNESDPTGNYGAQTQVELCPDNVFIYEKYNISLVPNNVDIDWVSTTRNQDDQQGAVYALYHVYNQTWDNDSLTWNTQPCGANISDSGQCNQTFAASYRAQLGGSPLTRNTDMFIVTYPFQKTYDAGEKNFSYAINSTVNDSNFATAGIGTWGWITVNYSYKNEPRWSVNQSSLPTEYDPGFRAAFNVTWLVKNETLGNMSYAYFECNYTGSATNYTMTNDSYGGDIYNYTMTVPFGPGYYYWRAWANTTDTVNSVWNATDNMFFTVSQNTTNHVNINISVNDFVTNITNDNTSTSTSQNVRIHSYLDFSDSGSALLYVDGVAMSNPYSSTLGAGIHTITANTTGNTNYTSNATGLTVYVTAAPTVAQGTSGGGGRPSKSDPNAYLPNGSFKFKETAINTVLLYWQSFMSESQDMILNIEIKNTAAIDLTPVLTFEGDLQNYTVEYVTGDKFSSGSTTVLQVPVTLSYPFNPIVISGRIYVNDVNKYGRESIPVYLIVYNMALPIGLFPIAEQDSVTTRFWPLALLFDVNEGFITLKLWWVIALLFGYYIYKRW